jgi:hypothetical protein
MTRRIHRTWEGQTVARGGRIESVTIGKMPGRQVTVYDKTREIVAHEKLYWWDLRGLDKEQFQGEVWRIEIRAGKAELDNWNLRSFGNLERIAGAVAEHILESVRYASPNADTEASRWPLHPLWSLVMEAVNDGLSAYSAKAERGKIIEGLRLDMIEHFQGLLPGLIASYGHLRGYQPNDLESVLDMVDDEILRFASKNPRAMADKFRRAEERYAFLR